jgi:hypothetical protein
LELGKWLPRVSCTFTYSPNTTRTSTRGACRNSWLVERKIGRTLFPFITAADVVKGESVADSTRIIYGGSVNGKNAKELSDGSIPFSRSDCLGADIDGFLVGGACMLQVKFC